MQGMQPCSGTLQEIVARGQALLQGPACCTTSQTPAAAGKPRARSRPGAVGTPTTAR